jgi:hypothetical protein
MVRQVAAEKSNVKLRRPAGGLLGNSRFPGGRETEINISKVSVDPGVVTTTANGTKMSVTSRERPQPFKRNQECFSDFFVLRPSPLFA